LYLKKGKKLVFRYLSHYLKNSTTILQFFAITTYQAPNTFGIEKWYFLTGLNTLNTLQHLMKGSSRRNILKLEKVKYRRVPFFYISKNACSILTM
jgi:hypothetical protein